MGSQASVTVTLRLLAAAYDGTGDTAAAAAARAEADRLTDPRDAGTTTLTRLLLTLTEPALDAGRVPGATSRAPGTRPSPATA